VKYSIDLYCEKRDAFIRSDNTPLKRDEGQAVQKRWLPKWWQQYFEGDVGRVGKHQILWVIVQVLCSATNGVKKYVNMTSWVLP
jgi:hypothetical protein